MVLLRPANQKTYQTISLSLTIRLKICLSSSLTSKSCDRRWSPIRNVIGSHQLQANETI